MIIGMETSSGGGGGSYDTVYAIGSDDGGYNLVGYKDDTKVYTKTYSATDSYGDDNISLVQTPVSNAAKLDVTLKKECLVYTASKIAISSGLEVMPVGTVLTHTFSGTGSTFQWNIIC